MRCVGLDIGGNGAKIGFSEEEFRDFLPRSDYDSFPKGLVEKIIPHKPEAVGIACTGIHDYDGTTLKSNTFPELEGRNLREDLEEKLGIRSTLKMMQMLVD